MNLPHPTYQELQSALRVIYTWIAVEGKHTSIEDIEKLISKTLRLDN